MPRVLFWTGFVLVAFCSWLLGVALISIAFVERQLSDGEIIAAIATALIFAGAMVSFMREKIDRMQESHKHNESAAR
jgi:predicted metal-binding membrane protein